MDELSIWMKGVLSGGPVRVDGTTFYLHSGKVRVCSSRRAKRKSRTEGEKRVTERFTEVRKMWRVFRRVFGELAVWDVAAREAGKVRGDALFHALNGGCIRPGEGVWAWSAFSFAAGSLDKAAGVEAQREGWEVELSWEAADYSRKAGAGDAVGWEVELSWEAADYSRKAGAGDAVYVGYFYAGMGRTPGLVRAEGARREDCRARVAVPDGGMPEGTALHLYLFFGNKAGTRFSPSVYVIS